MLDVHIEVEPQCRVWNPAHKLLQGLCEFGPVETVQLLSNSDRPKSERRVSRCARVQMASAEAAQAAHAQGTITVHRCVLTVLGPPTAAAFSVQSDNLVLASFSDTILPDEDLMPLLNQITVGVTVATEKSSTLERRLLFHGGAQEARRCIVRLQKPLLQQFKLGLHAVAFPS